MLSAPLKTALFFFRQRQADDLAVPVLAHTDAAHLHKISLQSCSSLHR